MLPILTAKVRTLANSTQSSLSASTKMKNGFPAALRYPLVDAIFSRRSRRIACGLPPIHAGTLTHSAKPPFDVPQPLSELEEALLIAATGSTGFTLPDRPFEDTDGKPILGTPNLSFRGRAAGSTDNSQPTYFLLLNDTGTYFLQHLEPMDGGSFTPEQLVLRSAIQGKNKRRENFFWRPIPLLSFLP